MHTQKALDIIKRPHLSKGQKVLYSLICKKLEREERLTFQEAKDIYINNSCRDVRDGIPYRYDYYHRNAEDKIVGACIPMEEWYLSQIVMMWLTHNIGCLVLKGYLKVIPTIDFNVKQAISKAEGRT